MKKTYYSLAIIMMAFTLLPFSSFAKKPMEKRGFEIEMDEDEPWEVKGNTRYSLWTNYPLALYQLDIATQGNSPQERALNYVKEYQEVLGLEAEEIEALKLHHIRESDVGTIVRLRQFHKGFPVGRSEVTITMDKENRIRFVMNSFRQGIDIENPVPTISENFARNRAFTQINASGIIRYESVEPMIYWNRNEASLVYKVVIAADLPIGEWHILVDAHSGEIIKAMDEAHYHSHGNEEGIAAMGTGPTFDPDPLSSATVAYGTGGYTDGNDADNADLASQVQTKDLLDITFSGGMYQLNGPYASIVDTEGPSNGLFSQASNIFSFNRFDNGFEATNTYFHVDYSMRYLNETLGCNIMPYQYSGGVRFDPSGLNGSDNSHYTGGSGVIAFGEGCVDDAEDSDVIHHELGHGLHDWVTAGGLSQVNGLSEGTGDYWAGSYNRAKGYWSSSDPEYYYMFNWDGHNECWAGRTLNYGATYPGGLTGGIHADGQIWASCLMDMWDAVGQQDLDKVFWEGLGMTNGSSNQNDAANAVYQAAVNLGYGIGDRSVIYNGFIACGYTMILDLPVELTEIRTYTDNEMIGLEWTTATELNNKGFEVERSIRPNTGFIKKDYVEGAGNSGNAISYLYKDEDVAPGIVYYYRVKQMDFDGTFEYSEIVSGKIIKKTKKDLLVFPNPVINNLNIGFSRTITGSGQFRIMNLEGKSMSSGTMDINGGTAVIPIFQLSNGMYFIEIIEGDNVDILKFILDK